VKLKAALPRNGRSAPLFAEFARSAGCRSKSWQIRVGITVHILAC